MKTSTSPSKNGTAFENQASAQVTVKDFLIVGIGAAAGGLQALQTFFENVPADSGIAYVVILHLSPDHDSDLAGILQVVAKIPVTQVTEKVVIEPNHVYVVSPNQSLSMEGDSIVASPIHSVEERRAPVDIFFRTLADSHQTRAVAVILSGTGADGSMGMKRIKENGGVAFVQNPREAQFNEMPRNSIATALVDAVLPVAEIPARITASHQSRGTIVIPIEPPERPAEQQQSLRAIFTQLRVRTGHDFINYKRATVLRRIESRINVHNLPDLPAYAAFIDNNPQEAQALLNDLLISVTNFFRDKEAFTALERDILPAILHGKGMEDQLRVWVAGCATGEEAYSLAMLLAERTLGAIDAPTVQIFATDIDEQAVAQARNGYYTLNDAADVSPERLRRFFTSEGDGFRVRREVREMILFANHNIIKDPPFSRLDLVTCRNMMIYLNNTAQERVMETLHFALNPGGYLFLGSSESVDGSDDLYAPVSKEHHIYQSRSVTSRSYPSAELIKPFHLEQRRLPDTTQQSEERVPERITYSDLHHQLLEQYAPPSIVINEDHEIVHLSEHAGRYLQISGGEPAKNLLKLIRPEFRLELRTALQQAVERQTNVEVQNLRIKIDDAVELIHIRVRPVLRQTDTARGFMLVIFEPAQEIGDAMEVVDTAPEPMARQLEAELERVKVQLRTAIAQNELQIEELKASNEELQAINEALRSSAEELETSREELQSINEELLTVNQELKIKVDEVSQSNNNFKNLINSSDISTLFLDRDFRVNLFTPAARRIFNLIPSDIGRSLADLTTRLQDVDLIGDAEQVMANLQTVEREATTTDGRVYMMRVLPYRTAEDRINGVVVTFGDITRHKQIEESLRASQERLQQALEIATVGIIFFKTDGSITQANNAFLRMSGYSHEDVENGILRWDSQTPPEYMPQSLNAVQELLDVGRTTPYEKEYIRKDGSRWWGLFLGSRVNEEEGVEFIIDVSARKATEAALRQSEEGFRLLVEGTRDYAMFLMDTERNIVHWNSGAERIFGFTREEVIGQSGDIIFTPEDRAADAPEQEAQTAAQEGRAADTRWHVRRDGTRFWADGVNAALYDETGSTLRGFAKVARDATREKAADEELQRAHNELELRVAKRTEELASSNEQLRVEIVGRKRSEATREQLLKRVVTVQEEERRRISRELHDQMGQQLTALLMGLKSLPDYDDPGLRPPSARQRLDELQRVTTELMQHVHQLAWELRPAALDNLGLEAALRQSVHEWAERNGVEAEFVSHGANDETRLPEPVETAFYRVIHEALMNVQRHAGASHVSVLLERRGGGAVAIIEDNGRGFDVEDTNSDRLARLGLLGMQERMELVGGTLAVESTPGGGTTVYARAPLDRPIESRE